MSNLFYKRPRLFALAVLMIIAAGASALSTIGRQEDPTITNLFATVITPYPGADPARVEALVTEKIETELREIPEIDNIESSSRTGISVITLELSQFISDQEIEQAWSEIRDALSDAALNFPPGVPQPEFDNDRTGAFSFIVSLTPREGLATSQSLLRRYGELIQDRLRAVGGTKFVRLYGDNEEEIIVAVDPLKLTGLGLDIGAVQNALRQADSKVEAGQLRGQDNDLLLEVTGEFKTLDRVREAVVRESADGRVVRVGDVARVSRGTRQPPQSLAYVNGVRGILIAARMTDDLQVDAWTKRIRSALEEIEPTLPGDVSLNVIFDQSGYTYDRLMGVLENMGIGVAIVIAVLLVTLGWRAAIVVAAILPLATLVSIAGLQLAGVSIHQMSVTGMIVALGLLVDAGIVMADDIRRRLATGAVRAEAVGQAVRRLAVPLLASTVTTILAFMPMALLPGPAGDFVGSIATAVIIMLIASLGLALTITPALSGWLLKRPDASTAAASERDGVTGDITKAAAVAERRSWFAKAMTFVLRHPGVTILASLIAPVIGFGAFPTLKPQFFPGVDRDQLYIQVQLPEGQSIAATDRVSAKLYAELKRYPEIRSVSWVVGESAPPFYYNMLANQDNSPTFSEFLVTTNSPAATEAILDTLQVDLDRKIPEARVTVRGLVQGPPVNAPVEIRIVGPNLETLRTHGEEVRSLMVQVPGIMQARTQLVAGAPKVEVDLDEEKVRLAGLTLGAVAAQLNAALEGVAGGSIVEGSEELPVRIRYEASERSELTALSSIQILPPRQADGAGGQQEAHPGIPLTALGEVRIVPAASPIYRRNGERMNTVQGFTEREVLPEAALALVQQKIDESGLSLPSGYRFQLGGDSDARDETLRNLLASMGLIVSLTVATIVLTFGSYRLALVTAVVALLSMGLSLLALAVFEYPFGIQAVIGVIGSIGVSINAAIIILTALQQNARAMAGEVEAIADVVAAQSRHIVSTTLTTFGGFLPLILEGGGFWPPFAMAIAGGVLLSTIVSFFFVPPVFKLLARGQLPSSAETVEVQPNREWNGIAMPPNGETT